MNDKKTNSGGDESGKSFHDHQRAIDSAVNEKIKSENSSTEAGSQMNRREKRDRTTDVSQKKTGGGKQKSPGD
jgi:hypothetical protein